MAGAQFGEIIATFADGQATGVNVGYGASILGRPMSAPAALEPVNQQRSPQAKAIKIARPKIE